MSDAIKRITDDIFSFRKTAHCAHALGVQYNPTAAGLSTSFLLNHACPQQPELNALITRFSESYSSVSMSRESKKTEEIKERLVQFWQCTDTAFE